MEKNLLDIIIILIVFPIYIFLSVLANYVQHYEYVFTDKNNITKYEVFNRRGTYRAYVELNVDLFRDMLDTEYDIEEVYEDKNYFIGRDYSENRDKKYYVVIDKNKNTTELFNSDNINNKFKNIENIKFIEVYSFLRKKGRKIGWYR